jgi:methionyl-tRNA formyltransferase
MQNSNKKKVLVIGYHEVACGLIEELIKENFLVVGVLPNKSREYQNDTWYRNIEEFSQIKKIPLWNYTDLNDKNFINYIISSKIDIIFSAYSHYIFPEEMLNINRLTIFNFHNSILPKYRGRSAPIMQIMNNESQSAMTLHYITKKVDAGDIVDQEYINIETNDNVKRVYLKLAFAQYKILKRILPKLKNNSLSSRPQTGEVSKFSWSSETTGLIDFRSHNTVHIYNKIRSLAYPFSGAFIKTKFGRLVINKAEIFKDENLDNSMNASLIIKIYDDDILIKTVDGAILLKEVEFDKRHILPAHWCSINNIKTGNQIEN